MEDLSAFSAKPWLRLLLDANGDDSDDIVDWGRRICRSCGDSLSSTSGFPAPIGCAR
jgi:hypothetical protein